jgi:MoaA/NifB/PqqE/SkfB family radical SAM enzyme
MYRPLRAVLETAHLCGMVTTVTSNGILLTARNLERLTGVTDLLAISLDGVPESHNRIRNSDRAFELMSSRLDEVRASEIPFGFIFTLTRYNVHELDWVAGFAVAQGARLLQIHPLEETGRARVEMHESRPDDIELGWALIEALRIQSEYAGRIAVHLDAATRSAVRHSPESVFAVPVDRGAPLAELVSPLVLEPDGWVVPLQYGFPRAFALGNLKSDTIATMAHRWRSRRLASYQEVCRATFDSLSDGAAGSIFNWYEAVAAQGLATT